MIISKEDTPIYDSAQHRSHAIFELREALKYRYLLQELVRRDVTTRYKRSFLGIAWTMLNPLGMMLVWTIAFSNVFKSSSITGFAAYVLSGILVWNFFSQTTTASMVNLVWGGGLLNRIYIPRASFALAAIGTGMVNLVIGLIPLCIVMLFTGVPINISFIFVPIPMLLLAAFSLGMGLIISTAAVYFPDVAEMYQIVLLAWMFLTPIMYPPDILPLAYRYLLLHINPMYYLVQLFRIPVYYGRFPTLAEIIPGILISGVVLVFGWWFFSNKADEFAYRI
jgi:ABC-2 type transport system permease protein